MNSLSVNKILDYTIENISLSMGVDKVSLMLIDKTTNQLYIKKYKGMKPEFAQQIRVNKGEGISGWVAQKGKALLLKDIRKDRRFLPARQRFKRGTEFSKYNSNTLISIPLKINDNIIGVLNITDKKTQDVFKNKDMVILANFGEAITYIIANQNIPKQINQQTKDEFLTYLSAISHEIFTPLLCIKQAFFILFNALKNYSEEKWEANKNIVLLAERNLDRITRFAKDSMDLLKSSKNNLKVEKKLTDINKLLQETVDFLCLYTKSKNIEIELSPLQEIKEVFIDSEKIIQVITNIVVNAVKFASQNSVIKIQTNYSDNTKNEIEIAISNRGEGIADNLKEKIFDRFYINKKGGCGLGLALSKEIIRLHNGRIWVDNTKNKETIFKFTIPLYKKML